MKTAFERANDWLSKARPRKKAVRTTPTGEVDHSAEADRHKAMMERHQLQAKLSPLSGKKYERSAKIHEAKMKFHLGEAAKTKVAKSVHERANDWLAKAKR